MLPKGQSGLRSDKTFDIMHLLLAQLTEYFQGQKFDLKMRPKRYKKAGLRSDKTFDNMMHLTQLTEYFSRIGVLLNSAHCASCMRHYFMPKKIP